MEGRIMKRVGWISTGALLLLGSIAPLHAQQEEAKPPKQEEKAKPEKQQKPQQNQGKQEQRAQKQQQDQGSSRCVPEGKIRTDSSNSRPTSLHSRGNAWSQQWREGLSLPI
jgi:hypothetical protein